MPARRLIGLLTLLVLIAIVVEISGVQAPGIQIGGGSQSPPLPGVQAASAETLLRVGAGAPPGGELAFMAVAPSGDLLVSDSQRRTVMRFDPSGQLLTEWGPTLGDTTIVEPAGVAVASNNIYVLDRGQPRIFRLNNSGQLESTIDLGTYSTYGLNGLAVDRNGNLYAADTGRNRILVFSPSGELLKQVGHGGNDLGGFTQPMMLGFAPDGGFFVSDWENSRIEGFDPSFEATTAWNIGFHAFGIAVDGLGRIYAPDSDHRRVEVYSPQGASLGEMGAPSAPAIDVAIKQVAVPPSGEPALYVLGSDGIQRLDLRNTAPPPQSNGGIDVTDLLGLLVIVLLAALLVVAILSRRQRQRLSVLPGAALHGKVELQAEDGAQRQQAEAEPDENLLIAHQPERK
jgi:hypothetical protein